VPLPALSRLGIFRGGRLDDGAALVARRPEDLLDEGVHDPIDVMVGVDHEQIDRADVPAGPDRRPQREDCATDDLSSHLGHEDARLGKVDELAKEIRAAKRTADTTADRPVAQRDDSFDVGDASRSDQIFHADAPTS
jgi:hypothetical protein